ncbi:hypothetical protein BDN72DRAFT_866242 [Pluteus cervinus]|uniref:Uncharacterized protein n=1 Tax=Pluteus cervinus TaxID=181527 RepID=A0ACD2ZX37_9AGAR|nr:hypothetical protein BDN72DRAFT_866242 [Pluteus cervinus]
MDPTFDFHMRKPIALDGTTSPAPSSAASQVLPHPQEAERDESPPNADYNHLTPWSAVYQNRPLPMGAERSSQSKTETPTIHDNPPVMDRQSHHLRNNKEWVIFWYECTTRKRLEVLPNRAHFPGIQTNDLFVHWISNAQPRRCQVWIATLEGENILWEAMRWGQMQQGRHFIIRSQGVPSLVEKSTWDRTYRRRSSTIIN